VDANGEITLNPVLAAGQTATAWTYGSASTGTATMAAGHTILNAAVVDVYWADGIRHGLTATVTDLSVALSGGAGDNLPASDTAVLLCAQVPISIVFVGNDLSAIVASASYRSLLCLVEGGGTVHDFELLPTSGLSWDEYQAAANPFAGVTIASGTISTTDPISALTEKPVKVGVLHDATPLYPG
jgi:hypothetical protein